MSVQTFGDIKKLQVEIMQFVDVWVHTERTPIPQKEILSKFEERGTKVNSVVGALNRLLRKGYIARVKMYATTGQGSGNKTYYKQVRGISYL